MYWYGSIFINDVGCDDDLNDGGSVHDDGDGYVINAHDDGVRD